MEANAGKSFQMQINFNIFLRISLHYKLVPVQYWENEYGLFKHIYPVPSSSFQDSSVEHDKREFKSYDSCWNENVAFK